MAKILITGGAGFIGSHLSEELARQNHAVMVYDNLSTGKQENISHVPHTLIQGDILDRDALANAMSGCDYVFHLAALTSVVESMKDPERYVAVNTMGTLRVLELARKYALKKVIYASSAAVYGESPELPKTEAMKPDPKSPYAVTKLDSEYYCAMYRNSFGQQTVCARFFNVFGERQDPLSSYAAAVPLFITRALQNEMINIFGDGEQTRDFIYVKDVAKALIFLMKSTTGVYNVGYGSSITINKLIQLIGNYVGSELKVRYVPERPGEIKHSYASVNALHEQGFKPHYSLEEGLIQTVQWYKKSR